MTGINRLWNYRTEHRNEIQMFAKQKFLQTCPVLIRNRQQELKSVKIRFDISQVRQFFSQPFGKTWTIGWYIFTNQCTNLKCRIMFFIYNHITLFNQYYYFVCLSNSTKVYIFVDFRSKL